MLESGKEVLMLLAHVLKYGERTARGTEAGKKD